MHNTTSTPIPFVNIRVVWSQKRYILTSNCVLHNSKWEHSSICQYCFKTTSPIPFLPLQFKGKERGRWVQLAEISQNKLSDIIVLPGDIAVHLLLVKWPSYREPCTCNMHKIRGCLISPTYSWLTSVSANTETNLKKNPRPVSVCLSYIKGNPTLGNQKEGFHVSKTIRIFKGGPQLTYNRSKPIESSAPSFFFSPCCECESWGSLIISLNSAPKKAILFTQLRNSDVKHPRLSSGTHKHARTIKHHQITAFRRQERRQ